jgi:hypothetical protein
MLNQVTGTRVRRVSFVRRAATRSHEDPAEPTRVLLWKSEDAATVPRTEAALDAKERKLSALCDEIYADLEKARSDGAPGPIREGLERAYGKAHVKLVALRDPAAARVLEGETDDNPTDERPDMTDNLFKRAIGRPATESAAGDGLLSLQQIEDEQTRIAPTLSDLYATMTKLRRDPTASPQVTAKVEGAHRELRAHYDHLDGQRGLAELRSRSPLSRPDDAPSAMSKAEELQKADSSLSAAEAFRIAMRDPAVVSEYLALTGRSPVPSGLSKAEVDHQAQEASVERRADELVKSQGLRPSQAYARALSESGVYSQAA